MLSLLNFNFTPIFSFWPFSFPPQHDSRCPAKEPAEMHDDKRALNTTTCNISYLPVPVLVPSVHCPPSDRCVTTGVSMSPPRRSS